MKINLYSRWFNLVVAVVLAVVFYFLSDYVLPLESVSRTELVPGDALRLGWSVAILCGLYAVAFLALQFRAISYSLFANWALFVFYLVWHRNDDVLIEHFSILRNVLLLFYIFIFVMSGFVIMLRKFIPTAALEDFKLLPSGAVLSLILTIFSYAIAVFVIGRVLNLGG